MLTAYDLAPSFMDVPRSQSGYPGTVSIFLALSAGSLGL